MTRRRGDTGTWREQRAREREGEWGRHGSDELRQMNGSGRRRESVTAGFGLATSAEAFRTGVKRLWCGMEGTVFAQNRTAKRRQALWEVFILAMNGTVAGQYWARVGCGRSASGSMSGQWRRSTGRSILAPASERTSQHAMARLNQRSRVTLFVARRFRCPCCTLISARTSVSWWIGNTELLRGPRVVGEDSAPH